MTNNQAYLTFHHPPLPHVLLVRRHLLARRLCCRTTGRSRRRATRRRRNGSPKTGHPPHRRSRGETDLPQQSAGGNGSALRRRGRRGCGTLYRRFSGNNIRNIEKKRKQQQSRRRREDRIYVRLSNEDQEQSDAIEETRYSVVVRRMARSVHMDLFHSVLNFAAPENEGRGCSKLRRTRGYEAA